MSVKRSTHKAFGISLFLHVLFISFFIASALSTPTPQAIPRRLLVQSIALMAPSRHKTAVTPPAKAAAREQQEPAPPPQPPPPSADEKHEENGPAEVAVQANEEHTAVEEQPLPAPQPAAKKTAQPAKVQPAKKSAIKGKAQPAQKSKSTPSKGPSKACSKKAACSQKPSYDQKLLSEALQRLDKSKSVAGKGAESGSGGAVNSVARVGAVGSLNAEQGLLMGSDTEESPFEGYSSASPEACYIGDLIRRLQLNVRMPEPGEVRVKLCLKRTGTVTSVLVLSGKNSSIKHSIEEKLRSIQFSPFGTSFSGEAEHTFSLRLSNELVWSCS